MVRVQWSVTFKVYCSDCGAVRQYGRVSDGDVTRDQQRDALGEASEELGVWADGDPAALVAKSGWTFIPAPMGQDQEGEAALLCPECWANLRQPMLLGGEAF